ncbi:MAG: mannose-6-phosphate isomerase, partial [Oscillospiraceae bacterium]|nr:mannose-6-phosphate isomerase [Oscillospiraceae bacterium]
MEPLFLKGAVKDYIWGGQKLKTLFGKKSPGDYIAESWELSCHSDGCATVINSKDGSVPLTQYV